MVATTAVVFGVAFVRSRHHPAAQVAAEAMQFAISAPGIMAAALVSSGVLTMVAFVAARLQSRDVVARLRLGPARASVAGTAAAVVAMSGLMLATGAVIDLFGLRGHSNIGTIASALARPGPGQFVVALATIAIAPGVAEETFFRGLIQTGLALRWGRWPSIVCTALGFGLMHFDLAQGLAAFVAGLFLGWLVERVGGIRPSIAAHTCNNAAFVMLASFGSGDAGTRSGNVVLLVVGLIAWIGATSLLRSRFALCSDTPSVRE